VHKKPLITDDANDGIGYQSTLLLQLMPILIRRERCNSSGQ
jgi:hypothetical protein